MGNIYFTIFSVEALIASLFLVLVSLFLFSIRGRSYASIHIAMTLIIFSSIPISYVIASSLYSPSAAYNRWISAYTSIPAALHVFILFFHLPKTIKPKFSKRVLWISWALLSIGWIGFIYATWNAPVMFDFSGHNWTLNADHPQRIVAMAIILGVLSFMIAGIWRTIITKDKSRWVVLGILISYLVVTVIPSIFNLRSRQGYMSRGTFMVIFNFLTVLGLFAMIIIYINNTKDRTSFMGKIIGVSMVTFLLIMDIVVNFSLGDRDLAYDAQHYRDAQLIIKAQKVPDDFNYIRIYNLKTQKIIKPQTFTQKIKPNISFQKFQIEYWNTYFMARLSELKKNLSPNDYKTQVKNILQEIKNPFFSAYKQALKNKLSQINENSENPRTDFILQIQKLQKTIRPFRLKLAKLYGNDIKTHALKIIHSMKDNLLPFKEHMIKYIDKAGNSTVLQANLLQYIADMKPIGSRFYREDPNSRRHFISYMTSDLQNHRIYEVGFSYVKYREFIHNSAKKFMILLILIVLFIVFGFRLFFSGALIKPLNSLLTGLKNVQKGETNVRLDIFVEDEIGFITRSFNSMVRAIRAAELKLQRYAESLEDKVKARTAELSDTLEAVQSLKNQQDGDYFLTSLILKPLGPNHAQSENIKIEFFVEQKKKFQFRRWQSDIGGDICISDNITLNDSRYVVFINGDAMGKSMQGAGGALVLGAAFQSVLERSHLATDVQRQSPERWLKNAFSEMHAIFESFDGSMLMSAIIGLIEEKTGLLYFINAEHPFAAIYRKGQARFIEEDSIFRKLGSAILAGRVFVQTYQLKHGDILYLGSDGRDDLMLGESEEGTRIINEDETLFLRCIEEADAQLELLAETIKSKGAITDDLSLMRIEYLNPEMEKEIDPLIMEYIQEAKEARQTKRIKEAISVLEKATMERKKHPLLFKELLKSFLLEKNYKEAAQYGKEYCKENPSDTQSLFAVSYALKKSGNCKEAIDFGERVRLRDPRYENNLVNLAECYFIGKHLDRAKKIAEEVLENNTNNERAQVLIRRINNQSQKK